MSVWATLIYGQSQSYYQCGTVGPKVWQNNPKHKLPNQNSYPNQNPNPNVNHATPTALRLASLKIAL